MPQTGTLTGPLTVYLWPPSRVLPIHQEMLAGGREPYVRHRRSYVCSEDMEFSEEPSISTLSGRTGGTEWSGHDGSADSSLTRAVRHTEVERGDRTRTRSGIR